MAGADRSLTERRAVRAPGHRAGTGGANRSLTERRPEVHAAFWRLHGLGVSAFEIGHHPYYLAAIEREQAKHDPRCPTSADAFRACRCRDL